MRGLKYLTAMKLYMPDMSWYMRTTAKDSGQKFDLSGLLSTIVLYILFIPSTTTRNLI